MQAPERPAAWPSRIRDWLSRERRPLEGEARMKSRPIMDRMLKEIFVSELRARDFTSSLPLFRRIRSDRIDLMAFQYCRRTGEFVVEPSQCSPEGIKTEWGK